MTSRTETRVACLLLAGCLVVLEAKAQQEKPNLPSVSGSKVKVSDLRWLAGGWRGSFEGGVIEQHWFAPENGVMVGSMRYVKEGTTRIIELYTLRDTPEGVESATRQFSTSLGLVGKPEALISRLEQSAPNEYSFKALNARLDITTKLVKLSRNRMTTRSDISGGDLKQPIVIETWYERTSR